MASRTAPIEDRFSAIPSGMVHSAQSPATRGLVLPSATQCNAWLGKSRQTPYADLTRAGRPCHEDRSRVGPPGLELDGMKHRWIKPQHVYPHDKPRRGGITIAGADRPRSGRRKSIPSSSTGGCRHRQFPGRPSGPGIRWHEASLDQTATCLPA